jgi:hypothetical protein
MHAGELVWILLQIEELPLRRIGRVARIGQSHSVGVVVDQLVAVGAHAVVRPDVVHVVVVLVEPVVVGVPHGSRIRRGQELHEAAALHALGRRDPGEVEQGLRDVDVRDERLRAPAGGDAGGIAEHERHPQRLLVHEPLVEPAVLAEVEALVGRVDRDRVVEPAALVQEVGERLHALVHRGDAAQVVLHVALVLPQGALRVAQLGGRILLEVDVREVVRDAHRGVVGGCAAAVVVVVEGGRQRDRIREQIRVPRVRKPGAVRGLVPHQHAIGLVALRLHPRQRVVGDDVGDVALVAHRAVRRVELRIEVLALIRQHLPVIEAHGVVFRAVAEVPLAEHRGAVARRLERRDEGLVVVRQGRGERGDGARVAVGAGEEGRATRRAQRVLHQRAVEAHPGGRDRVDSWRGVHD